MTDSVMQDLDPSLPHQCPGRAGVMPRDGSGQGAPSRRAEEDGTETKSFHDYERGKVLVGGGNETRNLGHEICGIRR